MLCRVFGIGLQISSSICIYMYTCVCVCVCVCLCVLGGKPVNVRRRQVLDSPWRRRASRARNVKGA